MPFPKVTLPNKRYLIVDVETGGFSRELNPLLEIGALLVDEHLDIVDSYHAYVDPRVGLRVEPGAAEVNGFVAERWGVYPASHVPTPEEIDAEYRPRTAWAQVDTELMKWAPWSPDDVVVGSAFNAPFDKAWIQDYAPGFTARLRPDWLCSMKAIKKVYTDRGVKVEKGMAKLGAVCDGFRYGELTGEAWVRHSALDDCYAARFVMAVAAMHSALG